MLKRSLISLAGSVTLTVALAGVAAAASPGGGGQPGAECGSAGATSAPAGFATGGFANAEVRYAGSEDTPSLNAKSASAVSQYDVACFQVTSSGH